MQRILAYESRVSLFSCLRMYLKRLGEASFFLKLLQHTILMLLSETFIDDSVIPR